MYYLNGEPLRLDKAFTDADGNQYPANWLRSSTPEQRDALGITWVAADPTTYYDQRFWWGVGNPKDLNELKVLWTGTQKGAAGSLLAPTDWYVVRAMEDAECVCPAEITQYRANVRATCGQREAQIEACEDVEALEALIKAPATIEAVIQEHVPAVPAVIDEETEEVLTPEVPEVLEIVEHVANPEALVAWPEKP